jgi:hypothetical protein
MPSDDMKAIDALLYQWGRWVKSGGSVRFLGYPSSSPFIIKTGGESPDDGLMLKVDHQVGVLQDPYRMIIRRNYIDIKPAGSKHKYYPARTQTEMARTERVTITCFKDILRMAKNRLIGAMHNII